MAAKPGKESQEGPEGAKEAWRWQRGQMAQARKREGTRRVPRRSEALWLR